MGPQGLHHRRSGRLCTEEPIDIFSFARSKRFVTTPLIIQSRGNSVYSTAGTGLCTHVLWLQPERAAPLLLDLEENTRLIKNDKTSATRLKHTTVR